MVTMENYEEYLLLYADGELGKAEEKELLTFIDQHPELKAEMDMYAATKLVPDEAVVYTGKEQLMKSGGAARAVVFRSWWIYGAAAACIAILFTLGIGNRSKQGAPVPIAQNNPAKKKIDTAVYEELHSKPVSPVAVKTKKEETPPVYAVNKKAKPLTRKTPLPKVKVPENKEETVAVKQSKAEQPKPKASQAPDKTTPFISPPRHIANETASAPVNELPEPEATYKKPENRKGILASLTTNENIEGLTDFSKSVGRRLEKIKDIPAKIKDTDVHFKIGKKDLFVVRL